MVNTIVFNIRTMSKTPINIYIDAVEAGRSLKRILEALNPFYDAPEFKLLYTYLNEYIDLRKPITQKQQIEIYSKHGYIEEGHNGNTFPSFDAWKKLNRNY